MKFKLNIQRNIILYVDFIIFIKIQRIYVWNKQYICEILLEILPILSINYTEYQRKIIWR